METAIAIPPGMPDKAEIPVTFIFSLVMDVSAIFPISSRVIPACAGFLAMA